MQLILKNRFLKIVVSIAVGLIMLSMLLPHSEVFAGYQPHATNRNIMNPQGDPVYYYQGPVDEEGNMDYYYYPIYDDPNYITDEEFFGVWDNENVEWKVLPMFNYTQYPDMAYIEEAAQNSDYEKAKEEFWKYYNNVKYDRYSRISSIGASTRRYAEQYFESISRNTYPNRGGACEQIGIVPTTNEWERYSVEATIELNTAKGSYEEFSVYFSSIDKYYTKAQIYSRESEYAPVLTATVNGVNMEFYPVKDAVIRGGSESKTNFGTGEILELEEHGCYDDTNKTYASYDETTSRALITFDISNLKTTDIVENAYVEFTAKNTAPKGQKEINLIWYMNYAWQEDTVNWDTFTDQHWFSCNDMEAWDYVTSSNTNVKGKVCVYHRNSVTQPLAQYYAVYGDERYAYQFIRHQMALINGIGYSPDVMNSLDMSTCVTSWLNCMFYTMESEYMTPSRFVAMVKQIILFSEFQVYQYYGTSSNNWATFATGSVYNFISRFPEFALHDEWFELTVKDNNRVMGGSTFDDGMCIELSHVYVDTILGTFSTPVSTSRATGHEVPFDEEIIQQMYDVVMTLLNSRGPYYDFGIADTIEVYDASKIKSTAKTWYNYGLFNDPHLEYVATSGAKGALPVNPTTTYPLGMRTYMRSGWGQNDLMLSFINTTSNQGSHGHNDALSVTAFAYGKYLLTDQGYGRVQTGDYWNYNRSPLQHNLVTVNDDKDWLNYGTLASNSTLGKGESINVAFESNMQHDFQEFATELYTTTQLSQRSVTFVRDDNFWIVTDYHIPNDPEVDNLFTQNWHIYPGAEFTYDENYVIRSNFDDVNIIIAPVENGEIDEIRRVPTLYSEAPNQFKDGEKAMIYKTKKGTGRFTTLLIPENVDEDLSVQSLSFDTGLDPDLVNAACFSVTNNKDNTKNTYYFYHLNDETKKEEANFGQYATDATTLLIKKNSGGEIVSVFMMNGTYIKDSSLPGGYLIKSDVVIPSISYKNSDFNINIASTTLTEEDMKSITIYTGDINEAYFAPSGSTLESSKKGGYIYFGDEPIVDAEDEVTDDEDKEDDKSSGRDQAVTGKPTGGSSGGGGSSSSGVTVVPSKPVVPDEPEVEPDVPDVTDKISYSDVSEDNWYYEDVMLLSQKGIVSGNGTGSFAPNDNVTREQFLKMLLTAAEIDTEETENTFKDVLDDAWYKPYVLKAKNFGIVNGISDTEFGIGTNITRQDMAVMISRAIDKLGIETKVTEVVQFADDGDASEYAKDAVIFMKSIGLIEGYNNEFRPLDNLTRAEAAAIISKFVKNFKI